MRHHLTQQVLILNSQQFLLFLKLVLDIVRLQQQEYHHHTI